MSTFIKTLPSAYNIHINVLRNALMAAGVWNKLDALYLFAAPTAAQANINLKTGTALTPVNAPAFTANRGYQPNGATSAYLDTGINPATAGGLQYTPSSACMFAWPINFAPLKQGLNLGQSCSFLIGTLSTQDALAAGIEGGFEAMNVEIVDGSNFFPTGPAAPGMYAGDRSGTTIGAYYDGYQTATITHGVLGSVFNGGNFLIGTANDKTVANNYSPNPIAAAGFGSSLGAAGQLALYNAVNTYLNSTGAIVADPVQAFFNRLQTTPSGARQTLYSNLINGLVTDGVWPKLDILWVAAAADVQTSRTNLVQDRYVVQDGSNGTSDIAGNIPFVVDTGYGPLGNTNSTQNFGSWLFDPSLPIFAPTAKYAQNDAHTMIFRQNTAIAGGGGEEMTFNNNHSSGTLILASNAFGHAFGEINTNEGLGSGLADITLSNNTPVGMTTISRSDASFCTLYANRGAPPSDTVQTATQNRVSLALAPGPVVYGQSNATSFCAVSAGRSLTAADVNNLYHRLYTYLHAVGAI